MMASVESNAADNSDGQTKNTEGQTEDADIQAGDTEKPLVEYTFEAGDFEGYNALLTVNGYQYPFALDFAADKMKLRVEPAAEEEI